MWQPASADYAQSGKAQRAEMSPSPNRACAIRSFRFCPSHRDMIGITKQMFTAERCDKNSRRESTSLVRATTVPPCCCLSHYRESATDIDVFLPQSPTSSSSSSSSSSSPPPPPPLLILPQQHPIKAEIVLESVPGAPPLSLSSALPRGRGGMFLKCLPTVP